MLVYNTDRKDQSKSKISVLKHLSTLPMASAERVEGMFSHQQRCAINSDLTIDVLDNYGHTVKTMTLDEHIAGFCDYARNFSITEYVIKTVNPLRLVDLWGDDPIGSAGPMVVDSSSITPLELKEIQALFAPYTDVIHPPMVHQVTSAKDIKDIKRRYSSNVLFANELKKRKARSKAIGEDFTSAQFQEIVWLDLTFRLKSWAQSKGYDSLVYANHSEGGGEDSYITLLPNQLDNTGNTLAFCEQKYLDEIPDILKEMIRNQKKSSFKERTGTLWAKQDPMDYWS